MSKKEIIVNSAYKLFVEKGVQNTKISDIAHDAGIGKGTFYSYFESKEALLSCIFNEKIIVWYEEALNEIVADQDSNNAEKLRKLIYFDMEKMKNLGSFIGTIHDCILDPQEIKKAGVNKSILDFFGIKYKSIFFIIESGQKCKEFKEQNPHIVTMSVMGAITFYMTAQLSLIPEFPEKIIKPAEWNVDELVDILLTGIC